jgi:hypothetical protein
VERRKGKEEVREPLETLVFPEWRSQNTEPRGL